METVVNEILEVVRFIKDNALMRDEAFGTFATKDDLKRFATKDDLKRFATKDDLKRFATKDDLKREIKESESRLMGHIDGLTKLHLDNSTEIIANRHRTNLIEEAIGLEK